MFITITIQTPEGKADIRIDSEQKISEGLRVLIESGQLHSASAFGALISDSPNPNADLGNTAARISAAPDFFRSDVRERLVSAHRTFAEEGIFDGDVLTVVTLEQTMPMQVASIQTTAKTTATTTTDEERDYKHE